jgi:hypothetical protein
MNAMRVGESIKGKRWRADDGEHIDVRGLPPPEPLVAILALVQSIADDTPVIVHHDRDPVLLYGELAALGWRAQPLAAPAGEVRLRLTRAP